MIRALRWLLRRDGSVVSRARDVHRESVVRQEASRRILTDAQTHKGPLEKYIWGAGKRND